MAVISGTSGNDHLTGTADSDTMSGRDGHDTLEGGDGDDDLYGGAGNDSLVGGAGADTLRGGAGDDTYVVAPTGDVLIEGANGGVDTVIAQNGWQLGANFENLVVNVSSVFVTGHARGNELDNVITCFGGSWINVAGGAGDDTLLGGGAVEEFEYIDPSGDFGHDVVDGGAFGNARLLFGDFDTVVDYRDGTAHGADDDGSWSVTFTRVGGTTTGAGNDLLIADDSGRTLDSGGGNDTMLGGSGDDWLYSAAGDDLIRGAAGNDTLAGDVGDDVLEGGTGNDFLSGHRSGADILRGQGGNDTLLWSAGDRINGGTGTDTLEMVFMEDAQHLDLTTEPDNRIVNIERIDLRDGSNTLTLGRQDLLALSSSTDRLKVLGDSGDSVDIVGAFTDEGVSGNFHRYRIGAAILLVDTDITDVH